MNVKNLFLTGILAIAAALTPMSAISADIIPLDRPTIIQVVDNFDGPYIGLGASTFWHTNEYTPTLSIGLDKRFDAVIVGGEFWGATNAVGNNTPFVETLGFDAKAGFVVTDKVAVYGLAGIEIDVDTAIARNSLGVGADVAVIDNLYITGSYKKVMDFGTFDNPSDRVSLGLKFPF